MRQNQASSTAFTVLQGVVYIAQHPGYVGLVSEDVKNASLEILSASQEGRKRLRRLESWWFPPLIPLLERLMMPRITLHYVLRKRYIEDSTLENLHAGGMQVVNLGAGFDTLAFRLAKQNPKVSFTEVDHPATQQIKAQALVTFNEPLENLHFLPVDFTTQRLEDVLEQSSWVASTTPTLCILEGVLMYLNQTQVQHLFESLAQVFQRGLRVIFTAAEPASRKSNSYGPLLKLYLRLKGEPFHWVLKKEDIGMFLRPLGYTLQQLAGSQEFKQRYLRSEYTGILHDGEYIVIADHGIG